jgi:voltage-gated potassium channel Kch
MNPMMRLLSGLRAAFTDARVLGLIGFTFTMIACASVFYHYVEGWGCIDATFFSVMTISTVGYGDITPQTAAGKIFTICYVLVGLGVFVTTASALADVLLSQRGRVTGSQSEHD